MELWNLLTQDDYDLIDQNCPECDRYENVVLGSLVFDSKGNSVVKLNCTRCIKEFTRPVHLQVVDKVTTRKVLRITILPTPPESNTF